jgi:hypothetical protein
MSGGDFSAVLSNGLASIRSTAAAAANSVDKLANSMGMAGEKGGKQFKKIGEAITKMGGPMGEIGGKLFGAAGMEGGLSRLAVAAAIVGVSFKVLTAQIAMAEARAQAFATAAANMRSAMRGADQARQGFAAGSEGTGRKLAAAQSVYGSDADGRAEELAKKYGIGRTDVLDAMVATRSIAPEKRQAILEAALSAARTGEGSAADFVGLAKDPGAMARILGSTGGAYGDTLTKTEKAATAMLVMSRGAMGPSAVADAGAAILSATGAGSGSAQDRITGVNQGHDIKTRGELGAFKSGETEAAIRGQSYDAVNPRAKAVRELYSAFEEMQKQFREMAALTPEWMKKIQNLGMAFGGEGSADFRGIHNADAAGYVVTGSGSP